MKSKALILVAVPVLFLQIGCGEKKTDQSGAAMQPVAAVMTTIHNESIPTVIEAPGTVQPRNRISLSSQINGFVREMRVRMGDIVKKDQILATLDARDAQSQKAAAQAAIDEAQAALAESRKARQAALAMQTAAKASSDLASQTFARYQKLFDSRSVSPQELDEAQMRRSAGAAELASREAMTAAADERIKQVEAKIAQAKAQASRADVMMGWTEIQSPSAGRVVQRMADPGTALFPGSPLLVIESMDRPQVVADIPIENAHLLRVGATVRIKNTENGAVCEGRIAEASPQSDPATHNIQFKIDLPSTGSMQSGQFVKVEASAGSRDALLASRAALRQTGQLTGMFVVDNESKAHFRLIKIAPYDAERVEILSGIKPGEKIITAVSDQIVDGTPITER